MKTKKKIQMENEGAKIARIILVAGAIICILALLFWM